MQLILLKDPNDPLTTGPLQTLPLPLNPLRLCIGPLTKSNLINILSLSQLLP